MCLLVMTVCTCHRPLKIRTDDGRSRVRELGSIGIFKYFYYNFVNCSPIIKKNCKQVFIYNLNKCCKIG